MEMARLSPPSVLFDENRVSSQGLEWQGRCLKHLSQPSAEVKERVDLYTSTRLWGPSLPVTGRNLPSYLRRY